jgi:hypothetical protein
MRKTTSEKLQSELAKRRQLDNQIKRLQQQQKADERKALTKRLIERGAIVESLIENPADLTNEQFKALIANALALREPAFPAKRKNSAPAEKENIPVTAIDME